MVVHLDSPDKRYDALYLRNFANLRIKDELARLPGVGQALTFGAGDYSMRVWLDPQKAAARGAHGQRHRQRDPRAERRRSRPARSAPADAERRGLAALDQRQGPPRSPEAFGEIVLKADGDAAHAPERRRAHRARREQLRAALAAQQRGRGRDRDLRGARRELDRAVRAIRAKMAELRRQLPRRRRVSRRLRPDRVRAATRSTRSSRRCSRRCCSSCSS